jgi:hypothetical protein
MIYAPIPTATVHGVLLLSNPTNKIYYYSYCSFDSLDSTSGNALIGHTGSFIYCEYMDALYLVQCTVRKLRSQVVLLP